MVINVCLFVCACVHACMHACMVPLAMCQGATHAVILLGMLVHEVAHVVLAAGVRKLQSHPKLGAVFPYFQRARLPDANVFDIRRAPPALPCMLHGSPT